MNVNNHKGSQWLPPELGKKKNIVRHYFTDNYCKLAGIQTKYAFRAECDKIHGNPNKAAHTDEVRLENFNQVTSSLKKLSEQRVFKNLYLLKEQYKPQNLVELYG